MTFMGKRDGVALLAITLIVVAAAIVAHPTDDIPLIDDWTYAWSVQHFLKTGELRVLDWSAHYPLVQILWGGLFSRIFGFSFSILRVSTLVHAGGRQSDGEPGLGPGERRVGHGEDHLEHRRRRDRSSVRVGEQWGRDTLCPGRGGVPRRAVDPCGRRV